MCFFATIFLIITKPNLFKCHDQWPLQCGFLMMCTFFLMAKRAKNDQVFHAGNLTHCSGPVVYLSTGDTALKGRHERAEMTTNDKPLT